MASFVVMEPPSGGRAGRDGPAFIRDRFSVPAFLVPPLWLAWHLLWIEAALALAATMLLAALGEVAGFGIAALLLSLLVSLYVGLEGPALRAAALARRGWRDRGAVIADDEAEAEIRWYADRPAAVSVEPPPAPAAALVPRPAPSGPALGMLHYPGKP